MSATFQVTFDCADPAGLSRFWQVALGYKQMDPPQGAASWEEFLEKIGVPPEEWNDVSVAVDPAGVKPNLYFQKVPEGKVVKNRLHLDIKLTPGPGTPVEERQKIVRPKAAELVGFGATVLREVEEEGSFWIVMNDPEGNEFCLT